MSAPDGRFKQRLLAERPADFAGSTAVRARGGGWFIDELKRADLRGRGGGAFPAWLKWTAARRGDGPRHVVVNGEEGEPAAWKDRYLLHRHAALVLDGAVAAALTIEASSIWIYVSDQAAAAAASAAVSAAADHLSDLTVEVRCVPHTYVAGEETAATRFLSGARAVPHVKPPRPFVRGIGDAPTLVSNVETFAQAALIAREGADAYRMVGTPASPGTFLAQVSGAVPAPALLEVAYGTPLRDILLQADADCGELHGVLLGGYFSGFMPAELLDTPATDEDLKLAGFGLGNGAIVAVGRDVCPATVIADLFAFFAKESAGQCGVCVRGTSELQRVGVAIKSGAASTADLARLAQLGDILIGRGACSMLDAAALTATRALRHFAPVLEAHLGSPCATCATRPLDPRGGFAIDDVTTLV